MEFDTSSEESPYADIPTRPMRVKVLYSFDQDNKTNCLARFPNTLQIPAVAIDENSQVGVIELRQCLQSIVSASPELLSRLSDGDFTIYAYDYSEYETPLVGQGMLSAVLAAAAPSTESEKTMITGRICKNIPALFSNGVKETLEVKLRLVPVSRPVQNDFSRSMDNTRGVSPATSSGFDPNAWNASVSQVRPYQQPSDYFGFESGSAASQSDMALVDELFGLGSATGGGGNGQLMLNSVGTAQTPTDPAFGFNPAFSHSAPGSRAGSPMIGLDSSAHSDQLRHQSFSVNTQDFPDHSRPDSRASVRSEVHPSRHQRQTSTQSMQQQSSLQQVDAQYNEDGQARKRVKLTQADWRGRSSFGAKSGGLRVTAATAHSMQMHRPVATRPGAAGLDLEPPPRAPTPVPQGNPMLRQQQGRQPAPARSFLRQTSTATVGSDFMSDADLFSDALMSSPEEDSPNNSITAEGTPLDIPSSPPVFHSINQVQPSSPGLPTLPAPRMADSGYMSERGLYSSGMLNNQDDDDENRSPDAYDLEVAAQYSARAHQTQKGMACGESELDAELAATGNMEHPSYEVLPEESTTHYGQEHLGFNALPKSHSTTNLINGQQPAVSSERDDRTPRPTSLLHRRSSLALPTMSSAPVADDADCQIPPKRPAPKRRSTKRSRAEAEGSEAGSPAPSDMEGGRPSGLKRTGSAVPRPVIIQQRLKASLMNGDIPQYCIHCGAIETPTWRKLYVKHVTGKPSPLDHVEAEGETIGLEPCEWEPVTGEVTQFIIRKSMKVGKNKDNGPGKDYETVTVCNPCGLWFHKWRNMRPANRWVRKPRLSKKKSTAGSEGPATDGLEPPSEAFFTDQAGPDDGPTDAEPSAQRQQLNNAVTATAIVHPATSHPRARASSMQPTRRPSGDTTLNASQLNSALARAVQSSPVRFNGSQASPIEIEDATPRPTRRLLFPSPRRDGEVKSLDDNGQVSLNATSPSSKGSAQKFTSSLKAGFAFENGDLNVFEAFTYDKENLAPETEMDDELAHLFEGLPTAVFKTPCKIASKAHTTTPPTQRAISHILKTPTPSTRKRKPLSPSQNAANNATHSALNDFMTSPSSSRYFLRSTPSRQDRTPGRSSQEEHNVEMTPFSRHLAQMLSDANDSTAGVSPSQAFDFSDLPTFTTPGRNLNDVDWSSMGDIISSDFAAFDDGQGASTGDKGAMPGTAQGEEA